MTNDGVEINMEPRAEKESTTSFKPPEREALYTAVSDAIDRYTAAMLTHDRSRYVAELETELVRRREELARANMTNRELLDELARLRKELVIARDTLQVERYNAENLRAAAFQQADASLLLSELERRLDG